jgi:hypothetical protein
MADEDERALFAQRDRDLKELYPTDAAWEARYASDTLKPPDDPELRQQYDDYRQLQEGPLGKALQQSDASAQLARSRESLDAHDRMMSRGAAEAARDALHDSVPDSRPGAYTTHEARDRAGHTPPLQDREP